MGVIRWGLSGGLGGTLFEDPAFAGTALPAGVQVAGFNLGAGNWLDSIQVLYSDGTAAERHGGVGGIFQEIKFAVPGEFIQELNGFYGDYISAISIFTNYNHYGSFGVGGGQYFKYEIPPGMQFVGFWGSSGSYVDALGLIVQYPD